ncbi:MAG: response regulator [Holophagales bacterium]|nr:response regulator [Holophagales bacterium]
MAPGETRRRILVADDVAENREILRQMLERVGFEVRTANDGLEALELLGSWRPHLLLMDLRMPGMDGLEATRTIRTAEKEGRLPIVAVTASAFEEDRRQVEEAGGDGFVSKPFREGELLRTVSRCLGIRYVFDDGPAAPGGAQAPGAPCAPSLPGPLRDALRAAVVDADLDRVRLLTDDLGKDHPDCAARLRELAERFEYDRLLAYLEEED